MVNNKTLGLTVLAILVMSLAVFIGQRQPETDDMLGDLVFPELKEMLPRLDRVEIISGGEQTTLQRDDVWQVREKDDFPVDFSKLSKLLDALAGARYEERKTSRPENYAVLDLRGVDAESSKAVLVRLVADTGTFELLIGTQAAGGRGQFVRHPDRQQVWLVDRLIEASPGPVDWLDPVIIDVAEADVVRVRHESRAGEVLEVERREGEDGFVVNDLPAGKELRYSTVADQLARALVNVRLKNVALESGRPADTATAAFDLAEGDEILVHAWDEDGKYFLSFDVSKEEGESDLNLEGWRFEVSSSTFDRFTRTMADMIRIEDDQEDAAAGG